MDTRYARLLASFGQVAVGPPADLREFLLNCPAVPDLPLPWDAWVLIGLVRHRVRQYWVLDIMRTRLRGDATDLAKMGAFGHPDDIPQSGPVPCMPEWEYYFHGRGCCISHKVRGDAIDVDFYDDTADFIDTYFYIRYLDSLKQPEAPEQRLLQLYPSTRAVTLAIDDLHDGGAWARCEDGSNSHRLAIDVVNATDVIDAYCAAWTAGTHRVWLAALVGDWLAAHEAAIGNPELTAITGPRAEQCRELWWQRLRRDLDVPYRGADALQALADAKAPDIRTHLLHALNSPPSGTTSTALDVIHQLDDPQWCEPLFNLMSRLDPKGDCPQPHLWITSLQFLLRHGYRKADVISQLSLAGKREIGEAIMLSLEHAPQLTMALVRKGLSTTIPIDRTTVAAILALIRKPWSTRELLRVLEVSDDQERTADARAALLEIGDPATEQAVLAWEEKNPHENEAPSYLEIDGRKVGPFYSFSELSLQSRGSNVRYQMDKLHDRVMKLRDVVPRETPSKRWWKFWGG